MNSNKNLVFLGMMGSGKSSIGAIVLIGKIEFPSPNKDIEKIIPNEKLKIIK